MVAIMATTIERDSSLQGRLLFVFSLVVQLSLRLAGLLDRLFNTPGKVVFDVKDPYPYFEALRTESPIVRSYMYGGWAVTGHEQITHLIRRDEISSDFSRSKVFSRMMNRFVFLLPVPGSKRF